MQVASIEGTANITKNKLNENGFLSNQSSFGWSFVGIQTGTSNSTTINGNEINNTGYAPISANNNGENPLNISNNTIDGFCKWVSDC